MFGTSFAGRDSIIELNGYALLLEEVSHSYIVLTKEIPVSRNKAGARKSRTLDDFTKIEYAVRKIDISALRS